MVDQYVAVVVSRLPTLAVLVVGLVLVLRQRRRQSGRALQLGLAGLVVLIGTTVVSGLLGIYLDEPVRLGSDVVSPGEIAAVGSTAIGLGNVVGLALLVAGLLARLRGPNTMA